MHDCTHARPSYTSTTLDVLAATPQSHLIAFGGSWGLSLQNAHGLPCRNIIIQQSQKYSLLSQSQIKQKFHTVKIVIMNIAISIILFASVFTRMDTIQCSTDRGSHD